jgi:hypothetical protein
MSLDKERLRARQNFCSIFKRGLDADVWGQSEEATEEYEELAKLLDAAVLSNQANLTDQHKSLLLKLKYTLQCRTAKLTDNNSLQNRSNSSSNNKYQEVSLEQIKLLQPVFDNLFNNSNSFPIDLPHYSMAEERQILIRTQSGANYAPANNEQTIITPNDEKTGEMTTGRGTLLPQPKDYKHNQTYITLFIEKIGLKDVSEYTSPHLTVLVAKPHTNQQPKGKQINNKTKNDDAAEAESSSTSNENILEAQTTPISNTVDSPYIIFHETVYLQTSLEQMKQENAALFIEFKHYKIAKKYNSVRCFTLMEVEELVKSAGQTVALEWYAKPTDFTRKTLKLHTVKKLYCYVTVTLDKH